MTTVQHLKPHQLKLDRRSQQYRLRLVLAMRYRRELNERIDTASVLFHSFTQTQSKKEAAQENHDNFEAFVAMMHKIVGMAGVLGYCQIGQHAKQLEHQAATLLNTLKKRTETIDPLQLTELKAGLTKLHESYNKLNSHAPPEQHNTAHKQTLLIFDDDQVFADYLEYELKLRDCKIATASERDEFLSLYKKIKPDGLILDIINKKNPNFGFELIDELKKNNEQIPPFVVISGRDSFEARLKSVRLGALNYFVKPFSPDDIVRLFKSVSHEVDQTTRIIVVDDSDYIQKAIPSFLEYDVEVVQVKDYRETISTIIEYQPALILLSNEISACSGNELMKVIQQHATLAHIPTLLLESSEKEPPALNFLSSTCCDRIFKTEPVSRFVSTVVAQLLREAPLPSPSLPHSVHLEAQSLSAHSVSEKLLAYAQRNNNTTSFAIIGVEHFNQLVLKQGLGVAETVLTSLYQHLCHSLRNHDFVIPYAENTFALILLNSNEHDILITLKRICTDFQNKVFGHVLTGTFSVQLYYQATDSNEATNINMIFNDLDQP